MGLLACTLVVYPEMIGLIKHHRVNNQHTYMNKKAHHKSCPPNMKVEHLIEIGSAATQEYLCKKMGNINMLHIYYWT